MSIHEQPGWPFSLLNDEQMSNNKVGVEHQPVNYINSNVIYYNLGLPPTQ